MFNSGVNKGSLVVEIKGMADNKTGADMLLTLRIAPLIQGNTQQQNEKANIGKLVKKKKNKSPF